MKTTEALQTTGYYRANRVGALLLLMTLCQYGVPLILFGGLRLLFGVDTSARAFGLPSAGYLCLYLVAYVLMMGIPLVCGVHLLHRQRTALSPLNLSPDRKVCVVLCGTALCMLANLLAAAICEGGYALGLPRPEPREIGDGSVLTLLMDLVVYAVVPAVMEEALLRGIVLQSLRPLGNGVAVTVSAVLFSLMHGSIDQVMYTLFMGLVLGLVFVYTDDLMLTVIIHALANALSLVSRFLAEFSSTTTASVWQGVMLGLVLLLGVLAALWLRRHPLTRSRPVYALSRITRWRILLRAPLLWSATLLMIGLMIVGNLGGNT